MPEPQSSLAQALLLGQRSGLPSDLKEDFRSTGTSHLLAISGLHVGVLLMLGLGVSANLLGRRRHYYLLVPLVLIWGYALLSGLSPSVLRAAIMGSVFLAALAFGRPRSALPALGLAAAVMVGVKPGILREVSFQLSFTAVAGIALLVPPWVGRWFGNESDGKGWPRALLQAVALAAIVSVAATIATLPLIAFNFHRVPSLGIPATVLALPALPLILVTSLVAVPADYIHSTLGQIAGWFAWATLSYLKGNVELFAQVPGSVFSVPRFSGLLVLVYYGLFALILLAPGRLALFRFVDRGLKEPGLERVKRVGSRMALPDGRLLVSGVVLSFFAAFAWLYAVSGHDGRLHVLFLDVGQGDSVLIVTPKGRQILVDGGPDQLGATRALGRHLPFWDRSLDLVVATHPDEDHLGGLPEVVRRYGVGAVLERGVGDNVPYLEWSKVLDEEDMEPLPTYRGQTIDLKEPVRLEVLHPSSKFFLGTSSDRNNNSVVLRLTYGDISFLLTADIHAEAEAALLEQTGSLWSTVLKVAHHGSRTSTSGAFLAAVDPQVAVIQAGADNPFGHPHQEVVVRLEEALDEGQLYLTSLHGTIEFITDGRSLWVKTQQ